MEPAWGENVDDKLRNSTVSHGKIGVDQPGSSEVQTLEEKEAKDMAVSIAPSKGSPLKESWCIFFNMQSTIYYDIVSSIDSLCQCIPQVILVN